MRINLLLLILLSVAVIMDFLFDKIYNEWILIFLVAGLSYAVSMSGMEGLARALVSALIPIIILYPLFLIGGMGAGDIKLLAVTGCFFSVREIVVCLVMSFFIGAVFSLLKMIAEGNFPERIRYLISYIYDVFISREWKLYEQDIQEKKRKNEGKIHFALPILLSVVFFKGGIYWIK